MTRAREGSRARAPFAAAALLALAAGCASAPAPPASAPPPPAAKPVSTSTATPAPRNAAAAARTDSLPSADAERVLASIPEPLPGAALVPPDTTKRRSVPAPEAAYDTLRVAPQDGEDAGVPVPAPTPVAAAPVVTFAPPESTARAVPVSPPPAPAAPAAAAPATATPAATAAGPCWRVQVAAPATRAEAESRLEAAQSLLVVKMAIVFEKGLYKVRTSECLTRETADAVKRRALDSGFDGSFLVDTSAHPAPAKPKAKSGSRR